MPELFVVWTTLASLIGVALGGLVSTFGQHSLGRAAKQTIDRMWVEQKTIHMLCAPEINEAARSVAFAVQDVIRDGPADPGEPQDEKVWEYIRPTRRAFLDVVREHLK